MEKKLTKLINVFFLSIIALTLSACFEPRKCISSSKVIDILELKHRDAVIKLENGELKTVNQATLKQGDMYCLAYK